MRFGRRHPLRHLPLHSRGNRKHTPLFRSHRMLHGEPGRRRDPRRLRLPRHLHLQRRLARAQLLCCGIDDELRCRSTRSVHFGSGRQSSGGLSSRIWGSKCGRGTGHAAPQWTRCRAREPRRRRHRRRISARPRGRGRIDQRRRVVRGRSRSCCTRIGLRLLAKVVVEVIV